MSTAQAPGPPLDRWPEQHVDPEHGRAWVARPGALIIQYGSERGTARGSAWVHGLVDRVLATNSAELSRRGGLLIVHDWRLMRRYDPAARADWMQRTRDRQRGQLRGVVVVRGRTPSPFVGMAVQAANLVTTLAFGVQVELSDNLVRALTDHRIERPAPSVAFPELPG